MNQFCGFFIVNSKKSNPIWKGQTKVSLNFSGLTDKVFASEVTISVPKNTPLLHLANLLDWETMAHLVLNDLKKTSKGKWWLGRRLNLRIHLGIYILQSMFNETDRGMENRVSFDAVWQIFCGVQTVDRWHVPDHTRIENFRSRLTAKTHHEMGVAVIKAAQLAGLTNPTWLDIDSTVQEANISYPSDANLMLKLIKKANTLVENTQHVFKGIHVDLNKVSKLSKEYFYLSRTASRELKKEVFTKLYTATKAQIEPIFKLSSEIKKKVLSKMDQRSRRLFNQVSIVGKKLLSGIYSFITTCQVDRDKPLSLHAAKVSCIRKGKLGKPFEFGRVYHLGRIDGNFLLIAKSKKIQESDRSHAGRLVHLFLKTFGPQKLESVGADRGYFSEKNIRSIKSFGVKKIAIQKPRNCNNKFCILSKEDERQLSNRRAGIEPLIGHVKQLGLRKSRMKKDETTEAFAYRCVMGFNLNQMSNSIKLGAPKSMKATGICV